MSTIIAGEKPALEMILNLGKQQKTQQGWYAGSTGQKGPSVTDPPIFGSTKGDGYHDCFYVKRESEGSVKHSFKNYISQKYARPESDPADGNVSVVEGEDSFLWTITSADGGQNGNLISVTSSKDGQTYYWGLSDDCEDGSDIKLRTDSTDLNNQWRFVRP